MSDIENSKVIIEGAEAKEKSIISHLTELRKTLIQCAIAILFFAIICGIFWESIFEIIAIWPLRLSDPAPRLIYTAPSEAIMLALRISVTSGIVLASPFLFYKIWGFIAPGLYKKEKAVILPLVFASTICFLAGIAYCYFLLPLLLQFLTGFATGQIDPYFRINEYLSFLIKTSISFGIAFEMPIVAIMLGRLGIIDHHFLLKHFRVSIVVIFILAALLTPPDVLSQIFLAFPLLILYTISIFLVYFAKRKEDLCETA
ncbi:MAG: twin-arginine translocase subunit TatC [Candidatus Cloacimonetes bacterium]|nr:twin-arginine translocase subunit TatC [Candidatus Cloacimonadota bacterium]